jgi:hypothetical protein
MRDDASGKVQEALNARGLAGKRDYVRSLEQRRDAQALTLLVECLSDESGYLRELAETALAKLGEPGAGPALLPLLKQGLWFARASAARALGKMVYMAGLGALLEQTEDRVESVAREAETDPRHGGPRAAPCAWPGSPPAPPERHVAARPSARADKAAAERIERLLAADKLMTDPTRGLRVTRRTCARGREDVAREQRGAEKTSGRGAPRDRAGGGNDESALTRHAVTAAGSERSTCATTPAIPKA